jgi:hypothetical protein
MGIATLDPAYGLLAKRRLRQARGASMMDDMKPISDCAQA